jgi:hypothetical protein
MFLIRRAARRRGRSETALLVTGWLLAYFGSHASAHWLAGRLGGIRFNSYGLHGTTNPGGYPPGMRRIMAHLPFLSARTDPQSRRAAQPSARALMYAAGPVGTVVASLGIPLYGWANNVRGSRVLLGGAAFWVTGMIAGEFTTSRSDLRRAWRELHT